MRSPLLHAAVLALALAPGAALGAALSAEPAPRDPAQIVLESGRNPVLVVSAIEQEVGPGAALLRSRPLPLRAEAPSPLVVLESPEEILLRHYRHPPKARTAGLLRTDPRLLDALLLLCSPLVIPLMFRRRTVVVEWPEDEEEELASPM